MADSMKFGVIVSDRRAEVHEHERFSIKSDEVLINLTFRTLPYKLVFFLSFSFKKVFQCKTN
jgi:hypothetical protein